MATLQKRLDAIKAGFQKQAPAEVLAVMDRAHHELVDSGIAQRILGEGAAAPAFRLQDSSGGTVDSADLLGRGPMVLTFYRGRW
jgi:hypothetical protein